MVGLLHNLLRLRRPGCQATEATLRHDAPCIYNIGAEGSGMYEIDLTFDQIKDDDKSEFRFHLCQYFDAHFDFNFPFSPLVDFFAECVKETGAPVDVTLPDYYEFEDFVEGSMNIDGSEIRIYFEHSLSFISFEAKTPDGLTRLLIASQGQRFQHEGYDLE